MGFVLEIIYEFISNSIKDTDLRIIHSKRILSNNRYLSVVFTISRLLKDSVYI